MNNKDITFSTKPFTLNVVVGLASGIPLQPPV